MNPVVPFGNPNCVFEDLKDNLSEETLKIIKDHIDYIILIVDGSTDNWIPIKQYLQRALPYSLKSLLSHRDPATRKQKPNDFDFAVMNYWKEKTGVVLFIPEEKLHPADHTYRPKGWNIVIHNELKSQDKHKRENDGKEKEYKFRKGRPTRNEQIIINYFIKNSCERSDSSAEE